jgi:hypothetical protein
MTNRPPLSYDILNFLTSKHDVMEIVPQLTRDPFEAASTSM